MPNPILASVIIPTYNGAARIEACLSALRRESRGRSVEVIVVDDGSTDGIADVLAHLPEVRLIRQPNSGPAKARNHGAESASADIILFTDDDCEPAPGWLDAMLEPFADPKVVGVRGCYLTRQTGIVARFVQLDYEDRYRISARNPDIDFIDTYSAAFRRTRFLELNGYDTSFPVACAEDAELSYRMSSRGWKMRFAPRALVYHRHPDSVRAFLKKKFKFAFWRVLAVSKNPSKAIRDSHTPQVMKLQLLLLPALLAAIPLDLWRGGLPRLSFTVLGLFFLSILPFMGRAVVKDPLAGVCSLALLSLRSCAQFLGVATGIVRTRLNPDAFAPPRQPPQVAHKHSAGR
jgi:GT2 family glycosyltransferase